MRWPRITLEPKAKPPVCRYCGRGQTQTVLEVGHPLGARCGAVEFDRCVARASRREPCPKCGGNGCDSCNGSGVDPTSRANPERNEDA